MIGKKYGPARVLPLMMFSFGSMTLLSASVKNFGGMMTGMCFCCRVPYTHSLVVDLSVGSRSEVVSGNGRECLFSLGHILSHNFL